MNAVVWHPIFFLCIENINVAVRYVTFGNEDVWRVVFNKIVYELTIVTCVNDMWCPIHFL